MSYYQQKIQNVITECERTLGKKLNFSSDTYQQLTTELEQGPLPQRPPEHIQKVIDALDGQEVYPITAEAAPLYLEKFRAMNQLAHVMEGAQGHKFNTANLERHWLNLVEQWAKPAIHEDYYYATSRGPFEASIRWMLHNEALCSPTLNAAMKSILEVDCPTEELQENKFKVLWHLAAPFVKDRESFLTKGLQTLIIEPDNLSNFCSALLKGARPQITKYIAPEGHPTNEFSALHIGFIQKAFYS